MFDSTRFLIHWNNNEQNSIVEILSLYPIETHVFKKYYTNTYKWSTDAPPISYYVYRHFKIIILTKARDNWHKIYRLLWSSNIGGFWKPKAFQTKKKAIAIFTLICV